MIVYGDLGSGNCLGVEYLADHPGLSYVRAPVDTARGASRTPGSTAAKRSSVSERRWA